MARCSCRWKWPPLLRAVIRMLLAQPIGFRAHGSARTSGAAPGTYVQSVARCSLRSETGGSYAREASGHSDARETSFPCDKSLAFTLSAQKMVQITHTNIAVPQWIMLLDPTAIRSRRLGAARRETCRAPPLRTFEAGRAIHGSNLQAV